MIPLEQGADAILPGGRVVAVRVVEGERPAELEVLPVVHAELGRREVVVVVLHQPRAQRRPREEIDRDWVPSCLLGVYGPLPIWHRFQVGGLGVEVVLVSV